jgi:hypothetical protein
MNSSVRNQLTTQLEHYYEKKERFEVEVEIKFNPKKNLVGQSAISRPSKKYALYQIKFEHEAKNEILSN